MEILYIHGLGGGVDSRIPSVLSEHYATHSYSCGGRSCTVNIHIFTYPFDPEKAQELIQAEASRIKPDLVIGESLGANHAMCVRGMPHLYVSPAMNAPEAFARIAPFTAIPGFGRILNRKFRPTRPGRQSMDFRKSVLKKYSRLHEYCMANSRKDYAYAFFGTRDHYMKYGIVAVDQWKTLYGDYCMYEGSHYMELEYLHSMLIPKINSLLGLSELL